MMKTKNTLLIVFLLSSLNIFSQNEKLDNADKSTVLILRYDSKNKFIGHGSGFFIDNAGTVVTNYHVVEGADNLVVKTSEGARYSVKSIKTGNKARDLVTIKLNTQKTTFKYLTISKSIPIKGTSCWTISTPDDTAYMNTFSTGIVSNIYTNMMPKMLQTDAAYTHGSSGGPIINIDGNVIGIVSSGKVTSDGSRANINFAIWSGEIDSLNLLNITRIISPQKKYSNTVFYLNYIKKIPDIYLYCNGEFLGILGPEETSFKNCDPGYIDKLFTKLPIGQYKIYALEKSTGQSWNFNVNIVDQECNLIALENLRSNGINNPSDDPNSLVGVWHVEWKIAMKGKKQIYKINPSDTNIYYEITDKAWKPHLNTFYLYFWINTDGLKDSHFESFYYFNEDDKKFTVNNGTFFNGTLHRIDKNCFYVLSKQGKLDIYHYFTRVL